ncbi:MAG: LytTR family DNA-binding domain-containing protein [Bacillota bacterium]|nr:LytTR family DNA-binding domain-containing protein [Bacillota bacterium]
MSGKLFFEKKHSCYALSLENIVYLEKNLRKIIVHTEKGAIDFYGTFKEVEGFLDKRFMHCHRSFIINMDKVQRMEGSVIYMDGGWEVPFGRDTYGKARKAFRRYSRESRNSHDEH